MLEINKNYLMDENQQPIAVQIPIAEEVVLSPVRLHPHAQARLIERGATEEEVTATVRWRCHLWRSIW